MQGILVVLRGEVALVALAGTVTLASGYARCTSNTDSRGVSTLFAGWLC